MKTEIVERSGVLIAVIESSEVVIYDVQSALDVAMTAQYDTGSNRVAINMEALTPDFFVLSTRIAGGILQKFVTYQVPLAIWGDFSAYTQNSKALRDFIYESNNGHSVFFTATREEAIERLSRM